MSETNASTMVPLPLAYTIASPYVCNGGTLTLVRTPNIATSPIIPITGDGSTNAATINLPTVNSGAIGIVYYFLNIGTQTVTITWGGGSNLGAPATIAAKSMWIVFGTAIGTSGATFKWIFSQPVT